MKCTAAFLVLSMVVFMAEPGECFWGALIHVGHHVLKHFIGEKKDMMDKQLEQQLEEQQQLDKRSVDFNHRRHAFD
ncbi:pleurocidin-like peptide WF3 [Stegastes partitus]|uniref:Pleurocidin-like peptide WF3 n=1 Tax=Stegastes partitus TaxID=144197 RepID=A0A9Y4JSR6_9TELE|nr:PREDICTED: pleurocidin-like peptide WF3 [Stegastes partitus]XP_008280595.1 PREDICTED: pleurocidin-like peptide WF3 [Stegastes partitus]